MSFIPCTRRGVTLLFGLVIIVYMCSMQFWTMMRYFPHDNVHLALEELVPRSAPPETSLDRSLKSIDARPQQQQQVNGQIQHASDPPSCAINLYGLPRAFHSLVLPSLIQNVISQNPTCDYFMHFYNITEEKSSRSGAGGKLDSADSIMKSFQEAVHAVNPQALVKIVADTNATYHRQNGDFIHNITNTMFTMDFEVKHHHVDTTKIPNSFWNILMMWFSQESAWDLMNNQQGVMNKQYEHVAMLRNDVFFATPIDILDPSSHPELGQPLLGKAVTPGFGRYPNNKPGAVSDRMIYGPYDAVEPWATNRWSRLLEKLEHLQKKSKVDIAGPSYRKLDCHEAYVKNYIIPNIQEKGFEVVAHPTLCFFRARAEETLWITDCFIESSLSIMRNVMRESRQNTTIFSNNIQWYQVTKFAAQTRPVVEAILGRSCGEIRKVPSLNRQWFWELHCPRDNQTHLSGS